MLIVYEMRCDCLHNVRDTIERQPRSVSFPAQRQMLNIGQTREIGMSSSKRGRSSDDTPDTFPILDTRIPQETALSMFRLELFAQRTR